MKYLFTGCEIYLNETLVSMSAPYRTRFVDMARRVSFQDTAHRTYLRKLENSYMDYNHPMDDLDSDSHRKEVAKWVTKDGSIRERMFIGPLTTDLSTLSSVIPAYKTNFKMRLMRESDKVLINAFPLLAKPPTRSAEDYLAEAGQTPSGAQGG